jgi:sugar phosphate isomerase/epimerase
VDKRFVKTTAPDFKIELLKKIIDKAREKGILICLENLSENCHDLEVAFDKLPLLNLTLDVGHGQLLREENTSFDIIKQYPDRIKHIHLHNNLGGNMPENDLHLPPGKGIVDFENIFYVHNTCFFVANTTTTWYLTLCVIFSFERYPHSRKQVWINNRELQ